MKNYTFKEWTEFRTISEGVDSDPQPGDFVITNPKAFMDSVLKKSGKLKNDGVSNLSNFSRFKIDDVDGRKVKGSVHHQTYSGGHSKKFNSYDFLDVSPAFNVSGKKVWINNSPGRRETAHYINKMYPIWAEKMGMDGFDKNTNQESPDDQLDPQLQEPDFQQHQEPEPQLPYRQVEPELPYRQVEPQDSQIAQPSYAMHNREVIPTSNQEVDQEFGNSFDQDSLPMTPSDFGQDSEIEPFNNMRLAANHDPSLKSWNGDSRRYQYYPE